MSMDDFVRRLKQSSTPGYKPERKGFTVWVDKDVFDWIDDTRELYGLSRLEFVRQLISSGIEQFKEAQRRLESEENS